MKIHAACMTQNELSDLIPNIEALLPHVHTLTIVDGGSSDLTIPYMRNLSKRNPKVNFIISPWENDFPKQRNKYLAKIREFAEPGDWLCTFDPDEYYAQNTLEALPQLIAEAEAQGKTMIGLQCISQTFMGPEKVYENLDAYHKTLIMKWFPEFHYAGFKVHESKVGIPHEIMDVHHNYYHRKQADVIWIRGMRNSFIGGGGPNLGNANPLWQEARNLVRIELGVEPENQDQMSWHDFYAFLLKGKIQGPLRDFIIAMRNEGTPGANSPYNWRTDRWDGSSEWREWYKSYFRYLHPEEEPEEYRNIHIP